MDMIELGQLPQHNFDLEVRHEEKYDANTFMARYYELLTGQPLDDEFINRFEKVLANLITTNAMHVGMLNEMNFATVEPSDAQKILIDGPVPSDEVQDMLATIRNTFDEAAEKYAEELSDITLAAPVDPNPTDEQVREARMRLARFICAAILTDDREENQL
ncbi:hypothetical protein MLDJOKPK_00048 [Salmonella phage SPAsTU]|nr:hypothetical protein STsAS_090 [Salmonella phage STsAS]AWN09000.1 hypothetical protein MLDJOKPK_00048 [Salmonella phage SPAsTU]